MKNKTKNTFPPPHLLPRLGFPPSFLILLSFPAKWHREPGNVSCGQLITFCLCCFFILALFPWSSLKPFPQDTVLCELFPCESFPWTAVLQDLLQLEFFPQHTVFQEWTVAALVPQGPQFLTVNLLLHGLSVGCCFFRACLSLVS